MITGAQIRAARAFLRWTRNALSRRSKVLIREIVKAESVDGIPSISDRDIRTIKVTLEDAGIEFIDTVGFKLRAGFIDAGGH